MRKYFSFKLFILLIISFSLVISCDFNFKNSGEEKEPLAESWNTAEPLKEIYKNNFLMGNIISPGDINNNVRFGYLKRHYNIVTAENHMKPSNLAPSSNPGSVSANWVYNFSTADAIVKKALDEGFQIHGHTLIWHSQSQSPSWLAAGGEAYLNKFVTDVVTHFKGKLLSWDVVNEAFRDGLTENDAQDWRNCLRKDDSPDDSPWYKSIGPDYIEKAFLAARKADPKVKLYYNDYNLNGIGKARATYNMVSELNNKHPGLIDGIGMQSHHHLGTNPQTVETSIKLFASLGVEIGITEMDIIAANWPDLGLGTWNDNAAQLQAKQYAAMFRIFKNNYKNISRVTFWGLDDGTSWRSQARVTLLNADYTLKPAFHAVMYPNRY